MEVMGESHRGGTAGNHTEMITSAVVMSIWTKPFEERLQDLVESMS